MIYFVSRWATMYCSDIASLASMSKYFPTLPGQALHDPRPRGGLLALARGGAGHGGAGDQLHVRGDVRHGGGHRQQHAHHPVRQRHQLPLRMAQVQGVHASIKENIHVRWSMWSGTVLGGVDFDLWGSYSYITFNSTQGGVRGEQRHQGERLPRLRHQLESRRLRHHPHLQLLHAGRNRDRRHTGDEMCKEYLWPRKIEPQTQLPKQNYIT